MTEAIITILGDIDGLSIDEDLVVIFGLSASVGDGIKSLRTVQAHSSEGPNEHRIPAPASSTRAQVQYPNKRWCDFFILVFWSAGYIAALSDFGIDMVCHCCSRVVPFAIARRDPAK